MNAACVPGENGMSSGSVFTRVRSGRCENGSSEDADDAGDVMGDVPGPREDELGE